MNKNTEKQAPLVIAEEQIALLERLSNACAVSGDEGEVRKIVLEQIRPYADEIKIDTVGNVLAVCHAKVENPLRVMLDAHMDEVGFMLVESEDDGIYTFKTIGGIDVRQLVGKSVSVGKNHIPGVIGARPIHLTNAEERSRSIPLESLRIDIGPGNGSKAKRGDWATYGTKFMQAGPSLRGKALDDRLGVATLIEIIKHAPPNLELLAAFTVQEEIGLRGARVAAYGLNPDIAIAVDSTPANDLPTWNKTENSRYNTKLDGGPALYVADHVTLSDPRLIHHFIQTAEAHHIPYQLRQAGGGGTDAGAIHWQREGIPSLSISVPGRYAHTAVMLARLDDWKNTISLIYNALLDLTPELLSTER